MAIGNKTANFSHFRKIFAENGKKIFFIVFIKVFLHCVFKIIITRIKLITKKKAARAAFE